MEPILDAIDARWTGRSVTAWDRVDLGVTEHDLADLMSAPADKEFRQRLWSAREAFRERTARQIVVQNGRLIVLSAKEQTKYALKQAAKARRKKLRALDVASNVPLEQLPEIERGRHVRRIDQMARTVAIEELCSRKKDPLVGLGEQIVASVRAREADALSRSEARAKLFGKT
jgi:hypothetical protein